MDISIVSNVFKFIGGIGMFLYGMHLMSQNMQVVAGGKFNNLLKFLTTNKFMGIIVGTLLTIVLNSSGATTVMVVGFVNAEILTLNQAIGVIMGANIGTTITAWIVSLSQVGSNLSFIKPSLYAPLIVGVAGLISIFSKKTRTKTKALIFFGIGLLFIGLSFMSDGAKPYTGLPIFKEVFVLLGKNPFLGIIAGIIVTILLQSSAASVSILQMLAINGAVGKAAAFYITMGQNIGTCFTAIISSAGASKNAKRTALLHLLFNVFGSAVFLIVILISYRFYAEFYNSSISVVEISIFHTLFNLVNTALLFPLTDYIVLLTKKIIPDSTGDISKLSLSEKTASILDKRILAQPNLAISTVKSEVLYYANFTKRNVERAMNLLLKERDEDLVAEVTKYENEIDKTNRILTEYLVQINNLSLDPKEHLMVEHMISMCSDIERIGDHAENIAENAYPLIKEDIGFSEFATDELKQMSEMVFKSIDAAIECVEKRDMDLIKTQREYEEKVDKMETDFRNAHIKRLSQGKCNTMSGIAFLDTIGNLERVSDHASNLVDYIDNEING